MAITTNNKILILGGGLIGLAIAHELAAKGEQVEILSKSRNEAAGFVAAGMLAPHAEGLSKDLLRVGQESLKRIPGWIEKIENESGIKCGFTLCGTIVPFLNAKDRDSYPTVDFGEILNRKELEVEVPGISQQWETALLFKQDGQIDNRRHLMRALEKACVNLGVQFLEGVEVIEVIHSDSIFEGVKIKNINSEIEVIKGKKGVLCSGAWSSQIIKEIPIYPVKGQMLSVQGPISALKRILFGPGIYLVPREDGLIIVGATSEKNAGFKPGLTPFGQQELHEGIKNLLPQANKLPQMERWWGFRPCTPDEAPILGESMHKNLWIATGHHRNGVLLTAITVEILTKCICQEILSPREQDILKTFQWDRFGYLQTNQSSTRHEASEGSQSLSSEESNQRLIS